MQSLLNEVIKASGISSLFAERTVRRAIERAGCDPDLLKADEITQCIPELKRAIEGYLGDQTDARIASIRRLAG